MLEQVTSCVVVAIIYVLSIGAEALSSIASSDKCVGSMVVGFVEYVAGVDGVDIVPVIPGHGIHRPAPHQAVVVPGKQPNFLASKICRRIDITGGFVRSLY